MDKAQEILEQIKTINISLIALNGDCRHYDDEAVLDAINILLSRVDENSEKLIKREEYKNHNPKKHTRKIIPLFGTNR